MVSLEEQLRDYEQKCVAANLELQKVAKKHEAENRKMKLALCKACNLEYDDIERMDFDSLTHKIRLRIERNSWESRPLLTSVVNEFEQTSSPTTPFPTSDSTLPNVYRPPPVSIPTQTQTSQPQLTITLGDPQTFPAQICVRLQVPPTQDRTTRLICCNVTYELLKHLIDEKYPFFLDDAGYELRDGVLVESDGGCVDAEKLGSILSQYEIGR